MKVTRYRQSWKKDAMCPSFVHSFLHATSFLNMKWKQDFSTQIIEERFSSFHYKTLYNFTLIGLLPFVKNIANSSRHVHPNPELNFHNSTLCRYMDSVNADKRFRAGRPRNLCSISGKDKNISFFSKPSRLPGLRAQNSLLYNGYSRRNPWRWSGGGMKLTTCCVVAALSWTGDQLTARPIWSDGGRLGALPIFSY